MTLRQGLTRLVDRGLLERQRGRGTFVREPKLVHSLSNLTGLHGELLSQGIIPAARLLTRAQIPASQAVADLLEITEETRSTGSPGSGWEPVSRLPMKPHISRLTWCLVCWTRTWSAGPSTS